MKVEYAKATNTLIYSDYMTAGEFSRHPLQIGARLARYDKDINLGMFIRSVEKAEMPDEVEFEYVKEQDSAEHARSEHEDLYLANLDY